MNKQQQYVNLLNKKIDRQWTDMIARINREIVDEQRMQFGDIMPRTDALLRELDVMYVSNVVLYWHDHVDAYNFEGVYNFVGLREDEDDDL